MGSRSKLELASLAVAAVVLGLSVVQAVRQDSVQLILKRCSLRLRR